MYPSPRASEPYLQITAQHSAPELFGISNRDAVTPETIYWAPTVTVPVKKSATTTNVQLMKCEPILPNLWTVIDLGYFSNWESS
jgi:hypothetical protein